MKWFKHMTCSHNDEKLARLLAEHGAEGYGFWWLLVELIAQQTGSNDDKCSVSYPVSYWMRATGFYHVSKLRKLIESLSNLSLISVECSSNLGTISATSLKNVITISIPNILKYRDEYSRKSGQKTESVRYKKEIQKEKENKEDSKTIVVTDKPSRPVSKKTDEEWLADIKSNPAYQGIDFDTEIGKAQAWCMTKGRKCSRAFLLNWFNRAEKNTSLKGRGDTPGPVTFGAQVAKERRDAMVNFVNGGDDNEQLETRPGSICFIDG